MTVYYVTIAMVLYLAILAQAMQPTTSHANIDARPKTRLYWVFALLAGSVLALVNGLRWRVGTDYGGYALNYNYYAESFRDSLQAFSEPGIRAIAWISSQIYDDYATMMLLSAVIIVGLSVWTLVKSTDSIIISLMLYILAGSWHGSFNGIRQHIAAAILFAGHRFIIERRIGPYLAVVTLAGLFHVSAFAFVLLYLVPRNRLRGSAILLLLGAAAAALYLSDGIIAAIETVTEDDYSGQPYVFNDVNSLRIAVAVAPMLLYFSSKSTTAPSEWFYRNMAIVHAVVMVAASGSTYLARFGIYTTPFLPLFIPQLVNFEDRTLTNLARVAVLLLFFYYWFSAVSPSESLNNFQWVFDRPSSTYERG